MNGHAAAKATALLCTIIAVACLVVVAVVCLAVALGWILGKAAESPLYLLGVLALAALGIIWHELYQMFKEEG
jgi:Osmosensitive K+ channel histidine kinase